MLNDLDKTIEELLRRELPSALSDQAALSFVAPDDRFPPSTVSLPAIDLFLYDIRENRELRSNEWLPGLLPDGSPAKRRAPTRVDCSYLVTAWPSPSSPTPSQDEHRMLGAVLRVLLKYPTLPGSVLQGELKQQDIAPPTATLHAGSLQSVAEFWQALGGRPKSSLHYTVTVACDVGEPVKTGVPVRESVIHVEPKR